MMASKALSWRSDRCDGHLTRHAGHCGPLNRSDCSMHWWQNRCRHSFTVHASLITLMQTAHVRSASLARCGTTTTTSDVLPPAAAFFAFIAVCRASQNPATAVELRADRGPVHVAFGERRCPPHSVYSVCVCAGGRI